MRAEEVNSAVAHLAGGLRSLGIARQDVVAWQLPNSLEAALLYRACWRIGAIAAPIHHRAEVAEIEAALAQLPPTTLLTSPKMPAADLMKSSVRSLIVSRDVLDSVSGPLVAQPGSAARPSDLAVVLFTSGSTGTAKAVLHTHRGLAYKALTMVRVHGLDSRDATLVPAPLAHVSGLLNGVLLPCVAGMGSILMRRWDPEHALELIESKKVSFMAGPPTFFIAIAAAGPYRADRVRSMRLISTGGAAVTPSFIDSATEAFRCRVKRTYGSTEAPTITTSSLEDPPSKARETDGRPIGEVELKLVDPSTLTATRSAEVGELLVRGPEVFAGYADPTDTASAITTRGKWFRTGDLATTTSDGYLRIVGRIKEIIIRGGENISAAEIEGLLEAHPEVQQAACVGIPDPLLGERLAAVVVAKSGFDISTCARWFELKGIARFKVPQVLVTTDALPLLAAGKPDRNALRRLAVNASLSEDQVAVERSAAKGGRMVR